MISWDPEPMSVLDERGVIHQVWPGSIAMVSYDPRDRQQVKVTLSVSDVNGRPIVVEGRAVDTSLSNMGWVVGEYEGPVVPEGDEGLPGGGRSSLFIGSHVKGRSD